MGEIVGFGIERHWRARRSTWLVSSTIVGSGERRGTCF